VAARGTGVAGMASEVGGEAAARLDPEPEEINVRPFSGVTYGKEIISATSVPVHRACVYP
jgi:hypothetical protein